MISGIGVSLASHLMMLAFTTNRMELRCLIWFYFMIVMSADVWLSISHTLFAQNTDQKLSQVTRAGTLQSAADPIRIRNNLADMIRIQDTCTIYKASKLKNFGFQHQSDV